MKRVTVMAEIMFIFIFVILPVIVGIVVEFLSNIITMNFIVKMFYIFLVCGIIFVFK